MAEYLTLEYFGDKSMPNKYAWYAWMASGGFWNTNFLVWLGFGARKMAVAALEYWRRRTARLTDKKQKLLLLHHAKVSWGTKAVKNSFLYGCFALVIA